MQELKRIGPLSAAKLQGLLSVLIGLIGGIMYATTGLVIAILGGGNEAVSVFMITAVLWMPVVYGLFGFLGGLIGAGIYNVVARAVGGIEMEFD